MLMPLLEAAGIEAYAVDLIGWGFTEAKVDPKACEVLGPAERRAHLLAFCQEKVSLLLSNSPCHTQQCDHAGTVSKRLAVAMDTFEHVMQSHQPCAGLCEGCTNLS